MVTKELSEKDFEIHNVLEGILWNTPLGSVLISSNETHFH